MTHALAVRIGGGACVLKIYSASMVALTIPFQRLVNQHIMRSSFKKPAEVITWLGAVQAQDFGGSKWALGLRLRGRSDTSIQQAFNEGTILRTHLMRPTWHFVTSADIRWMLALTAPRVHTFSASYYRKIGLDEAVFKRANTVLAKALQGGKQLTRPELASALQQAGIATDDLRLIHLMMHAELDAVLCSGAQRGKQFTYALFEERVPRAKIMDREEALAELAQRYFSSHGPATLQDFTWWSGLAAADARIALAMVKSRFNQIDVEDKTYWFAEANLAQKPASPQAFLLPCYDEYIVGYTDRSAISGGVRIEKLDSRGNVLSNNIIVLDGLVVGTWKRTLKKSVVEVELKLFTPLNVSEQHALRLAAERYGNFLALSVVLKFIE